MSWKHAILAAACGTVAPWLCAQSARGMEAPVRLKAGDAFIDTGAHVAHSGPLLADLDGDGKQDLLVGNFRGNIHVFRNTGTAREPRLVDEGFLKAEGEDIRIHNW